MQPATRSDMLNLSRTSLHYACAYNRPNVVAWLVSNDCTDINTQDDEGCTALIKATQRDNVECVSILLMTGADPHILDFGGDAALHHAVVRGNITIAAKLLNGKLLKYKADINAKTKYGMTPYKLALYEGQHLMAEYLIKNGAEAHAVIKPNRISENPDVPESRTEVKGSTSATKEDTEISSSSHTVCLSLSHHAVCGCRLYASRGYPADTRACGTRRVLHLRRHC